jgi:hypothetical protein
MARQGSAAIVAVSAAAPGTLACKPRPRCRIWSLAWANAASTVRCGPVRWHAVVVNFGGQQVLAAPSIRSRIYTFVSYLATTAIAA